MKLSGQSSFEGKNAHIIGMARSGIAAAEVLSSLGAAVTMHDQKDAAQLGEAMQVVRQLSLKAMTGDAAYEGIDSADLVITSPGVPEGCPGLISALNHNVPVMSEIELAYRLSSAPIIAVTGTNGKTTTVALIGEMLRCDGRQVHVAGNIVAGEIRLPLVRAAVQAKPTDVIVAEISSFQLEWITSFRPKVSGLLNVSNDHLDRHPDIEAYARTKARIFEHQETDDHAVLNADDARVSALSEGLKGRVWWFSSAGEVDAGTFLRGSEVWVSTSEGKRRVCDTKNMKLRGRHNLDNVLASAAVVLAFGGSDACIQEAVDTFRPLEHRLEPVAEINGVEFLNNSMCTNVVAAMRSLEAIGRPAVVIAGGKDKGADYTPLGETFRRHAKHLVLIGRDAPLIERAARNSGFERISNAVSMEEAVETAWLHAEPGDTVVLSPGCASFDMFNDFEHRGRVFKAAVADLADRMGVSR